MPVEQTYYNQPWYGSYRAMMSRCYKAGAKNYRFYGGRGIAVCEEWHDIAAFGKWAVESGYSPGMSIDRIDPQKGYYPENCRWATPKEQANNRRNTVFVEFEGERHSISEWAEIKGIKRATLNTRIHRGWNAEKALARRNYYADQAGRSYCQHK